VLPADLVAEGLRRLDLRARMRAAITPDPGSPFARVATLESSYFLRDQLLRDIDWASMAHSVEVRVPLVDAHLLLKLAPLVCAARDYEKSLLAHAPASPLPPELMHRRKTGFLLPMKEWLQPMIETPHAFGMRGFAVALVETLMAA
jgi:asparagine synthase (glutamine-hydrolysing)